MSKPTPPSHAASPAKTSRQDNVQPCKPIDVVDGIPDRAAHVSVWKCVLMGMVFAAWLAFLIYCALAGNVKS